MSSSPDPGEVVRLLRDRIRPPKADQVFDKPDAESRKEQAALEISKKQVEVDVARYDLNARKQYAGYAFLLVVGWLVFIAFTILLQGFHMFGFNLDYKIILALIGGNDYQHRGHLLGCSSLLFLSAAITPSHNEK